jgi:hypothetical protein
VLLVEISGRKKDILGRNTYSSYDLKVCAGVEESKERVCLVGRNVVGPQHGFDGLFGSGTKRKKNTERIVLMLVVKSWS